jgi:hypothetical protein
MQQPTHAISYTGTQVEDAIKKALTSAKKATDATTVVTDVKFADNKTVYSAEVNNDETLVLSAVTLETTTDEIYEAEDNTLATN